MIRPHAYAPPGLFQLKAPMFCPFSTLPRQRRLGLEETPGRYNTLSDVYAGFSTARSFSQNVGLLLEQ